MKGNAKKKSYNQVRDHSYVKSSIHFPSLVLARSGSKGCPLKTLRKSPLANYF